MILDLLNRLWSSIQASAFFHTVLSLSTAFVLGTLIGLERQWRQRSAGLRTNVLVAIGAAAFTDLGTRLMGVEGATRIIAYVVSGIGFLGAGVILKDGANIRGLNTAATLWCSAAVGTFAGAALWSEAIVVAIFVLAGNTMLRPLVNFVNRRPIAPDATEALYRVHAVCDPAKVSAVRDLLFDLLEAAGYPLREIESLSESPNSVELAAVLVPTTADPVALDRVTALLQASPSVQSATWTVSTTN